MSTGAASPKSAGSPRRSKPRRGRGGCCGCLVVLILLLSGGLWLARKWAPNHLNRGLAWSRTQIVTKYPVLDRWLPQAPGAHPPTVFEPPAPAPLASPAPAASPSPTPSPASISSPEPLSGTATDILVGAGAEVTLGQTVVVRYGAAKPTNPAELFMVGSGEIDPTLEAAVKGMKVGGKRKLGAIEIELLKIL